MNPKCADSRALRFDRAEQRRLERFFALDTDDSLNVTKQVWYRNFCYQLLVGQDRRFGLFRVTTYNRSHWGARYIIHTPRALFLIYPRQTAVVETHALDAALAAPTCDLTPATKEAIRAYVNTPR